MLCISVLVETIPSCEACVMLLLCTGLGLPQPRQPKTLPPSRFMGPTVVATYDWGLGGLGV